MSGLQHECLLQQGTRGVFIAVLEGIQSSQEQFPGCTLRHFDDGDWQGLGRWRDGLRRRRHRAAAEESK
jgi:hypothetical protein